MTGRMVLEQKRFRQIIDLISIVFHDSNHKPIPIGVDNIYMNINTSNIRTQSHTTQHTQHPSFILNHVDELICEINFWKSELSKLLTNTSNVLWRPILIDMKVSVTSISSKLIVVGLVDMIGKPLLMLYPVWMLCQQVLIIVNNLKLNKVQNGTGAGTGRVTGAGAGTGVTLTEDFLSSRGLNIQVIFQLIKAILLLVVISKFIKILELFQGIGTICVALGTGLYALSLNEVYFKKYIPVIAPNIMLLHSMMDQVIQLESMIESNVTGMGMGMGMGGVGDNTMNNTNNSTNSNTNSTNPRLVATVRDPSDVNTNIPIAVAVHTSTNHTNNSHVNSINNILPSDRVVEIGMSAAAGVVDYTMDYSSYTQAEILAMADATTANLRRRRK